MLSFIFAAQSYCKLEQKTQKILVIRFSSIGDIILCTPVFRLLRAAYPQAEIHFLTKKEYVSLVQTNPNVDFVWTLSGSPIQTAGLLKKQHAFDLVIDLHHNLRTYLLTAVLQAPTLRYRKANIDKQLRILWHGYPGEVEHVSKRAIDTLAPLGIVDDGLGLDFLVHEACPEMPFSIDAGYIVWAIGAQHATKQLPWEIIRQTIPTLPLPIVFIGGKEDWERGERIAQGFPSDTIYNACGKWSIAQSAAAIQHAQVVCTNDTGMMHIAAALHKPIVVTWGNTSPVFGMYPYYGTSDTKTRFVSVQVEGLSCRPCHKIGFNACPAKHFRCMSDIRPQVLAQEIQNRLTITKQNEV